jgi:hypothetical protein
MNEKNVENKEGLIIIGNCYKCDEYKMLENPKEFWTFLQKHYKCHDMFVLVFNSKKFNENDPNFLNILGNFISDLNKLHVKK